MNSDSEAVKEILNTLFSHLEKLETQTEGIIQFLKGEKKVTDAQLAPYLEQAGKASNVRWRAARVRIEYLIAGAEREESRQSEKKPEIAAQKSGTAIVDKQAGASCRKTETKQDGRPEETDADKESNARKDQKPKETKEKTESAGDEREDPRKVEVAKEKDTPPEPKPGVVGAKESSDPDSTKKSGNQEAA